MITATERNQRMLNSSLIDDNRKHSSQTTQTIFFFFYGVISNLQLHVYQPEDCKLMTNVHFFSDTGDFSTKKKIKKNVFNFYQ